MKNYTYPATLTADEDGGYVVTFRDLPEAISQGDDQPHALAEAQDCLAEAIAGRIDDGEAIPTPSRRAKGEHDVVLPLQMALKAALYDAYRDRGYTKVQLGQQLAINEKAARRLLDPHHNTRTDALADALNSLGRQVRVALV